MSFVVGLTGGIGSGKSTVASCFSQYGATIIDADVIARKVIDVDEAALAELQQAFGMDIVDSEGRLIRACLAERAFASRKGTSVLNSIMHPRIRKQAIADMAALPQESITVYDMPLLVETKSEDLCDVVVVVNSPIEERVRRLQKTRGMSVEEISQRIAQQASDSDRNEVADIVIDNNGTLEHLTNECKSAWATILEVAHNSQRRTLSP